MQEDINILVESLLVDSFNYRWWDFTDEELRHLATVINHEDILDRLIVENESVRDVIIWDKMDRMKIIRVTIGLFDRGIQLPPEADLSKHNYKVKEVKYLLERKPEYSEAFNFNLRKLKLLEAHMLLSMGKEYFFDNIPIEEYKLNYQEYVDIIRAYNYEDRILSRIDLKVLNGHNITEILIVKGIEYSKFFNLKKLTPIDWIDLLKERPEMLVKCNLSIFDREDVYYLIQLVVLFDEPDMTDMILERDISSISPLGWEKLLIHNPDKFIDLCDFSCLNELNWNAIKIHRPELLVFKL